MGIELSRGHTVGMIAASSLSICGSATIITAFFLFPKLRKKPTYEAINYIAISNLLSAACSITGEPVDGSPACWIEGFGTNIFTLASIFWNVVVNYIIFRIVANKPIEINIYMHMFSWGLACLVTFLPMINVTYGAPDGMGWCWVVNSSTSPPWALMFWYWASYYIWVWSCVLLSIAMFIMIYFFGQSNMESTKKVINKIIFKLMFYPPVIIICWGLTTVHDTIYIINSSLSSEFKGADQFYYMNAVLPCLQGSLTTIVFWYTMSDIRKRFIHMIIYGKDLPESSKVSRSSVTGLKSPHGINRVNRVHPSGSSESHGLSNKSQTEMNINRVVVSKDKYAITT